MVAASSALGWRVRVGVPCGFVLLFALLWSPAMVFAQGHREYHCTPDTQYECISGRCERATDSFQHAESFIYNTKNNELSACLWTNCYAATAVVLKDEAAGTLTATGKLKPALHLGNEPVIVSLTIRANPTRDIFGKKVDGFTAVWGYGNKGLTLDTGKCETRKSP